MEHEYLLKLTRCWRKILAKMKMEGEALTLSLDSSLKPIKGGALSFKQLEICDTHHKPSVLFFLKAYSLQNIFVSIRTHYTRSVSFLVALIVLSPSYGSASWDV